MAKWLCEDGAHCCIRSMAGVGLTLVLLLILNALMNLEELLAFLLCISYVLEESYISDSAFCINKMGMLCICSPMKLFERIQKMQINASWTSIKEVD